MIEEEREKVWEFEKTWLESTFKISFWHFLILLEDLQALFEIFIFPIYMYIIFTNYRLLMQRYILNLSLRNNIDYIFFFVWKHCKLGLLNFFILLGDSLIGLLSLWWLNAIHKLSNFISICVYHPSFKISKRLQYFLFNMLNCNFL